MTTKGDVTIALVGDMFIGRPDPASIFAHAADLLRKADIAAGNLEGAITDAGEETRAKQATTMSSSESAVAGFVHAGFDVVSLANNHTMNRGEAGLLRSIELLEGAGIAHCGGGRNLEEARRPAILERNGTRVAFLSYSSVFAPAFAATPTRTGIVGAKAGTSFEPQVRHNEVPGSPPIVRTHADPADLLAIQEDVRQAKQQADVVVVEWHWGLSGATGKGDAGKVIEYQVEYAHAAIDAGADLITGHHPHQLEGIEVYKGKVIFYSLGNFAFDAFYRGKKQQTIIAQCLVRSGSIARVSFVPTEINEDAQPIPLSLKDGDDIVRRVDELSAPFKTGFRVADDDVVVETGVLAGVS